MAEASLSINLAAAAGAALAGGTLARLLRQSALVGYIAAGLVLSPFTPGPVGDAETIERLADVGVVLLMFSIGVHFSLRQLAAVRPAGAGAAIQIPLTLLLAMLAILPFGWSWKEALFFGAAASISGGTVLTKLLADRGEEDSGPGRVAIGWSVSQDLATVALVILLSVLAGESEGLATTLGLAVLKAGGFLAGMVVIGTRVLPWVLGRIAQLASRELFILAVGAIAMGTAVLAEQLELSLALGAFIAGVVVSESDLSHHALGEVLPLREIFAALFFVSVGMLVNPRLIAENLPLFLFLVVLVLSKGAIVAVLCLLVLRYPARTAALAGLGLAQSAEFSFILARQGVEAGAVSGDVFSLIIAATAATTIIAPSLFRFEPALESALARLIRPNARTVPLSDPPRPLRNHVVICGAGRVGSVIAEVLRQRRHSYILIETDWRRTQALRVAGEPVLYGDAAAAAVLERAHLGFARTLVVALPDPVTTRRVVDAAKEIHPRLDIVVRASSAPEAGALLQRGVAEAVIPEREVALEMTRHTLQRIGVPTLEAQALLQRLRHDVPSRREGGE